MRDIQTTKVIVSVSVGTDEVKNAQNARRAFDVLRAEGIEFRMVRGAYKGVPEEAFLLYTTSAEQHQRNLAIGMDLARSFGQEAILEIENDNTAHLHRLGTGYAVDKVGTWREVSKAEAVSRNGYTADIVTGRYFIID